MSEPTEQQITAARKLAVSLYFSDAPLAIAKLCEVVAGLQKRIEELEQRKGLSWRK